MRNAITYTALAAFIALATTSVGYADQAKTPAESGSATTKGEGTHMMDGKQMPMMDMMQEMSTMMKNCNAMMEQMNKQMGQEAPKDGSKVQ
ncbi:hypothetical protein Pres01_34860 [Metapseudomonas resinovorans]|uniref:hypothetical protein n=1 Tax=Metapseudomonas resinovorans TaxID=53412 RepID=UPI000986517F|nr:hypothetical protein [Pseudomonas resinovorans]GLZ87435.1 hypothetical protein Pres01_34860 [Pseudomonas resinovorans]